MVYVRRMYACRWRDECDAVLPGKLSLSSSTASALTSFFSQTAVTGRLALELSQIRFSRIIFQYSHRPISPRNLAPDPRNAPLTAQQPHVHFPRDHQALDIYTELPRTSVSDIGFRSLLDRRADLSLCSPPRSRPTRYHLHRCRAKSHRQALAQGQHANARSIVRFRQRRGHRRRFVWSLAEPPEQKLTLHLSQRPSSRRWHQKDLSSWKESTRLPSSRFSCPSLAPFATPRLT